MLRHIAKDHGSRERSCAADELSVVAGETGPVELQQPNAPPLWAREDLRRMVWPSPSPARSTRRGLPPTRQSSPRVSWLVGEEVRSRQAECRMQSAESDRSLVPSAAAGPTVRSARSAGRRTAVTRSGLQVLRLEHRDSGDRIDLGVRRGEQVQPAPRPDGRVQGIIAQERARSLEPVLHLQAGDSVEIAPVTGDEGEVPSERHAGQPDVLLADDVGVEQEHSRSVKLDLAVRGRQATQGANLLQSPEERVVVRQPIPHVVLRGCGRLGCRIANEGTQGLLQERAKRLALLPGLMLKLAQERFINVQRRLHGGTVGFGDRAVNVAGSVP